MLAERNHQVGLTDLQNLLFIYPSEGPGSLAIQEKLLGASNYKSWRRNVEIGLGTKQKLEFVQGIVTQPIADLIKAEMWNTCNSITIAWIINFVSKSVGQSILFPNFAQQIWLQLDQRFALSDGSDVKQNLALISEYYTKLKCLWEELEDMNELPKVSVIFDEITTFLQALTKQREEQKLFQFLNGLDDKYAT